MCKNLHTNRMLDKVSICALNVISNACQEVGVYVVLEVEDIIKNFPIEYEISSEKLLTSVRFLSSLGYVNLKYLSDKEFCLSLTDSGKNYIKDIKVEKRLKIKLTLKIFCFCFLGALIGGFLGSLLARVFG